MLIETISYFGIIDEFYLYILEHFLRGGTSNFVYEYKLLLHVFDLFLEYVEDEVQVFSYQF